MLSNECDTHKAFTQWSSVDETYTFDGLMRKEMNKSQRGAQQNPVRKLLETMLEDINNNRKARLILDTKLTELCLNYMAIFKNQNQRSTGNADSSSERRVAY